MSYQYIFNPETNQPVYLDSRKGRRCLENYLQRSGGICSGHKSYTPITNQDCPDGCQVVHYPRRGRKSEYWFCNEFKPKPKYEVRVEPMRLRPRKPKKAPNLDKMGEIVEPKGNCRGMKSEEELTNRDCQAKGSHCRVVHQRIRKGPKKGTEYWYCNSYQREKKVRFEMTPEERSIRQVTDHTNLLERNRTLQQITPIDRR